MFTQTWSFMSAISNTDGKQTVFQMQKLADRGLPNISSQLTDPSAPLGIIKEWKIGGAVGSVNYIFTQQLW